jgi:hypothetical protein
MSKKQIVSVTVLLFTALSLYAAAILSQAGIAKIKGHGDVVFHQSAGTVSYDLKCQVRKAEAVITVSNKKKDRATVTIKTKQGIEFTDTAEVIWQLWK